MTRLKNWWDQPEYWEESWRTEKTCCHSNSSEKPSAEVDVKKTLKGIKKDKYLDLPRELKKPWDMKVTIVPIVIGAFGTVTKGGLGSWRTSGDHLNDSIIEDGQNTEKSPGDLRRVAVTQTPMKNHQLTLMWKTLRE